MPKYDFTCVPCDSTVEMHLAFDSTDRPACDRCGNFMTKVWTPPAVQFKGGGWGGQG
jgi:putative FmdB family regulatory protein